MPLDPLDYYDNISGVVTLMAWSMRGHHPAPNPVTLTPEQLEREVSLRSQLHPDRRWILGPLAQIIADVIRKSCVRRGSICLDVVVGRTCVYAAVLFGGGVNIEDGLHDAVRLVTTRRARSELDWPRDERVFVPQRLWWPIGIEEACVDIRVRKGELGRL